MDLGQNHDGYDYLITQVDLPGEGSVHLRFIQQFGLYSLDLPVSLHELVDSELEWVIIHEGEFDKFDFEEVEGNGNF